MVAGDIPRVVIFDCCSCVGEVVPHAFALPILIPSALDFGNSKSRRPTKNPGEILIFVAHSCGVTCPCFYYTGHKCFEDLKKTSNQVIRLTLLH